MGDKKRAFMSYSVLVRKEGNQYASWCPELDIASSGKSIELACKNLRDAVNCFIETYAEIGELDKMIAEKGIILNHEENCPSVFLSEARIGVPTTA